MNIHTYLLALIILISGCVSPNTTFEKIPPGIWRAVLMLDRKPVQEYGDDRDIVKKFDADAELPFNFEVVYDNDSTFHLVIFNAEEKIVTQNIRFGRDKATGKDTVEIDFPIFDTRIKAIYEDGIMEGDWIVNYRENYKIPFKAVHGKNQRFEFLSDATANSVDGQWECQFEVGETSQYNATAIFKQLGSRVTGTFLTETGDYRFLDGMMVGKKLYLSAFDGAHAFLFLGKILEDGSITGTFRSGSHYTTNWAAQRSAKESLLRDPYQLTKMRENRPLQFSFPDVEGNLVNLDDEKFQNKAKIIQIMGTWCPNCLDETQFLMQYFKENPSEDIALVSLCFERYKDAEKAISSIQRYKENTGVTHDVLYAGYFDKKEALKQLPQLDTIMSYPTMLFVDKNNYVQSIHTGFSGPATPGFKEFSNEFSQKIKALRN
jgi:thiol-disulfide isomerase/thioredoxin